MKIVELTNQISATLSKKISLFEHHFTYPYGKNKRFRIDHGSDYSAFYRAIGSAQTYYLENDDQIIGSIGTAIKEITFSGKKFCLSYIGDLKIIPQYHNSKAIIYLMKSLQQFLQENADMAYCIVMDGTETTPACYTGRSGIIKLNPVTIRYILRIYTDFSSHLISAKKISETEGHKLLSKFVGDMYLNYRANYHLRSEMTPCWISSNDSAVGMLEDTKKAKRLYLENGEEIISSHLSYFTYSDEAAGINVIMYALQESKKNGYSAMFIALDENQYKHLMPNLSDLKSEVTTATIYCTGVLPSNFLINTSEI